MGRSGSLACLFMPHGNSVEEGSCTVDQTMLVHSLLRHAHDDSGPSPGFKGVHVVCQCYYQYIFTYLLWNTSKICQNIVYPLPGYNSFQLMDNLFHLYSFLLILLPLPLPNILKEIPDIIPFHR